MTRHKPFFVAKPASLFVVAHDGGCEGYSLPLLAFTDKASALKWCKSQDGSYSVAEVPVFPELPAAPWYRVEPVTEGASPPDDEWSRLLECKRAAAI